jgi:hypothetical protein
MVPPGESKGLHCFWDRDFVHILYRTNQAKTRDLLEIYQQSHFTLRCGDLSPLAQNDIIGTINFVLIFLKHSSHRLVIQFKGSLGISVIDTRIWGCKGA